MEKEKIIPFVIHNCDNRTYRDMWWGDELGVVCFDWTRQGNPLWLPPQVAVEWARQKRHLRDKKPRDVKAGLRNALDKKQELVKGKEIEEPDGRKTKYWKFKDLESEREKLNNPPLKNGPKKKTINQKNIRSQQDFTENQPSACSSTSDFKERYPEIEKNLDKEKDPGKRRGRRKVAGTKNIKIVKSKEHSKNQLIDKQENACFLPPIEEAFGGTIQGMSQPPLQSQTIFSTQSENWFRDSSECWPSAFQQSTFSSSGPTPPPQPNDVELPRYFNFKEAPHYLSTEQWHPSQYGNYPRHIGFPESQTQVQNIHLQSDINSISTSSCYLIPPMITSTSTNSYLNLQDLIECCPLDQEIESHNQGIPILENPVTELLQSEEIMNSVFLPQEFDDHQLFNAVLNGLQLNNSNTI